MPSKLWDTVGVNDPRVPARQVHTLLAMAIIIRICYKQWQPCQDGSGLDIQARLTTHSLAKNKGERSHLSFLASNGGLPKQQ